MTCLVLDLNGLLWRKIKGRQVLLYKGVIDFLKNASKIFDKIAFYTSTTSSNALPPLKKLLKKINVKPLFIWTRDQTEPHPIKKKYHTYKPIQKIEEIFPGYIFICVDDDHSKMYSNDLMSYIITESPPNYINILVRASELIIHLETEYCIRYL